MKEDEASRVSFLQWLRDRDLNGIKDNLYLESIDVYFAAGNWTRTFCIGCFDQYGLFQEYSRFNAGGTKGYNHIKLEHRNIPVPAGNGVFMRANGQTPLFAGAKKYGDKGMKLIADRLIALLESYM